MLGRDWAPLRFARSHPAARRWRFPRRSGGPGLGSAALRLLPPGGSSLALPSPFWWVGTGLRCASPAPSLRLVAGASLGAFAGRCGLVVPRRAELDQKTICLIVFWLRSSSPA